MLCAGVDWSASNAAALTPELLSSALQASGDIGATTTVSSSSSSGEGASRVQSSAGPLHEVAIASDSDSSTDEDMYARDETEASEASSSTAYFDEDEYDGESDADDHEAAAEPAEGLLEAAGASVGWSR
jgi:hypothetical protein